MLNRSTLNEALRAKPDCLTPEELEKCVQDPAHGHPHLSACPRCQAELALLKSFESNDPLPGEGAGVTWISAQLERRLDQIKHPGKSHAAGGSQARVPWFSRILGAGSVRWLMPLTALLVIAVTTGVLLRRSREPQLRADAGNGPAVYRSQEIEVSGPAGELAEAPKSLQWKVFAGAVEYRVSIMEVDEVPLWSGETRDLSLTIPGAVRVKMLPGKPVLWRVTALDSQGRTLAASQLQRFSVQHKSPRSNSGVLSR